MAGHFVLPTVGCPHVSGWARCRDKLVCIKFPEAWHGMPGRVPLELAVTPGYFKMEKGPGSEPFRGNRKILVVAIGVVFGSIIGRKTLKSGAALAWMKPFVPNVRHHPHTWRCNRRIAIQSVSREEFPRGLLISS